MNFILSCEAVLRKHDLERAEIDRKWTAAMWGVELKDSAPKPSPTNGNKRTMTQQDIMRNYHK